MSTTTTEGVSLFLDDNKKHYGAFSPKTGQRITAVESTTGASAVFDSGLIRVVASAAINFNIRPTTTDVVTTSMAYLPANTVEYFKINRELDKFYFLGSSIVYVTSMK